MTAQLKMNVIAARTNVQVVKVKHRCEVAQSAFNRRRPTADVPTNEECELVQRESPRRVATASKQAEVTLLSVKNIYPTDTDYGEHAAAFLSGNFTPVGRECTAVLSDVRDQDQILKNDRVQLTGTIPVDFPTGQFAYVGPNPKFPLNHYKKWGDGPGQRASGLGIGWHHWFEGDGMIFALTFKADGSIIYRNRYVRTDSWKLESMRQTRIFRPLMNADGATFLYNAACNFVETGSFLKDSANTALFYYAGKMLSLQDTQDPWEVDPHTLKTVGRCTFNGSFPLKLPFTAHPKIAPSNGDMIFFGFNPVSPPHCTIGAITPSGNVRALKPLWSSIVGSIFMHDFVVTNKYTILYEGSMDIEPVRQIIGRHPLQYNENRIARFGLLPRDEVNSKHGDVVWYDCSSAQSVFHFVNAWEEIDENDNLVIVIIGVREDGFFHNALKAKGARDWIKSATLKQEPIPRMHEWRISVGSGAVEETFLFNIAVETPRINDAYGGKRNRYAYAGRIHTESLVEDAQLKFNGIVKFDLHERKQQVYEHAPGIYGMEPQFIAREDADSEDDGWLVMYIHDENGPDLGTSYCAIFDARNIMAGPLAKIAVPERVPYGAHALWMPLSNSTEATLSSSAANTYQSVKINAPKKYAFRAEQIEDLLKAVTVGVARGASGLFMHGWRPGVKKDSPEYYSFARSFGMRLAEQGRVGSVRKKEILDEIYTGFPASPKLVLYDIEGNSECKVVREALSILDICCLIKPCPHGAVRHQGEAAALVHNTETVKFPVLLDVSTGDVFSGAKEILNHLYIVYLDGARPPSHLSTKAADIALRVGGKKEVDSCYASPTKMPVVPLTLWAYEASPFCAVVRDKLCEMELPYILRPCARASVRRDQLQKRTGTFQVPYLEDPNTNVNLFESAEIIEYIESQYGVES
uniref:GST N-terminal domain-containing protein n=1 Tax=Ostreococcus mediterraneus TaxID=1486918 RepID=A0A6T5T6P3_9CHLO|mmetsp:Transcript_1584/g.4976  ORF Transcript_1584/g.4976 Transcript_1584/m.4976 type:complete len:920 (+) Transcript_1584:3270-6029(+)